MTGQMMYEQLTVNSLIDHAARFHGATEVVSVETTGELSRSTWAEVSANARRLASALDRLGVAPGARVGGVIGRHQAGRIDAGIDLRGRERGVAEQFLDRA